MNVILIWLTAYCIPAILAGVLPLVFHSNRILTTKIAHVFVAISILLSLFFLHLLDLDFPWPTNFFPVGTYILVVFVSVRVLGKTGLLYGLSALLQELTMLLIGFILLQSLSLALVILMIVPLFVLAHDLAQPQRYLKAFLFFSGASLFLFLFTQGVNIFYIATLHVLIGTWLIRVALIYRFRPQKNIKA